MAEALMNLDVPKVRPEAPAELEEERLLRAFRDGKADAFEALYRRHRRSVYGLAYRLTGSAVEAEELVQEVFVRAWDHRSRFRNGLHLARWLRRVAVNTWINQLRRRESTGADDGEAERLAGLNGARAGAPGLRVDLERALAALPPRLRAVLLLFDLYGLRHDEIADQLDITVGASKIQLHRTRKRLREMLR